MGEDKSEFYTLTLTGGDDPVPIDLGGASSVVFQLHPGSSQVGTRVSNSISNVEGSTQYFLIAVAGGGGFAPPIVVETCDERLWLKADSTIGEVSNLYVWVIKRGGY
jgi:hypothetical protein